MFASLRELSGERFGVAAAVLRRVQGTSELAGAAGESGFERRDLGGSQHLVRVSQTFELRPFFLSRTQGGQRIEQEHAAVSPVREVEGLFFDELLQSALANAYAVLTPTTPAPMTANRIEET
jgi:hypothetical protein